MLYLLYICIIVLVTIHNICIRIHIVYIYIILKEYCLCILLNINEQFKYI